MLIYNVTVHVEPGIENNWLEWMKKKHIPQMLATGKFTKAKLFKVISDQDQGGTSYATQYHCVSKKDYQDYLSQHAPQLRKEVKDRFADTILSFRTELEEIITLV